MGYDTAGLEWELRERKGSDDLAWGGRPIRSFVLQAVRASTKYMREESWRISEYIMMGNKARVVLSCL
jgi:hypothetical protein